MLQPLGNAFRPERRRTRVVRVGNVEIGGDNPIRIQSMTNTDTMDTLATVQQVAELASAGCEIVRVTAPSVRDAENLREIRRQLVERGIDLVQHLDADVAPLLIGAPRGELARSPAPRGSTCPGLAY